KLSSLFISLIATSTPPMVARETVPYAPSPRTTWHVSGTRARARARAGARAGAGADPGRGLVREDLRVVEADVRRQLAQRDAFRPAGGVALLGLELEDEPGDVEALLLLLRHAALKAVRAHGKALDLVAHLERRQQRLHAVVQDQEEV